MAVSFDFPSESNFRGRKIFQQKLSQNADGHFRPNEYWRSQLWIAESLQYNLFPPRQKEKIKKS